MKWIRRPTRAHFDRVVLNLAEKHGTDLFDALKSKYTISLERKGYEEVVPFLVVEGMLGETDGSYHLTSTGRQHLHNLRFQRHLKMQLWLAIAAITVSIGLHAWEILRPESDFVRAEALEKALDDMFDSILDVIDSPPGSGPPPD